MRDNLLYVLIILGAIFLSACGGDEKKTAAAGSADAEITIVLNWFPEAEHGGYYAALVHGYYAEEGLNVRIIPGGVDVPVAPPVAAGQITFGVTNADDLIFARAQGAPVAALMAPMQKSPRVIIVHEESGKTKLADLRDMTLAMSPKGAFAQYIRKNFPLENVRTVPYAGNIAPFLADKNFGTQGYNISETFLARQQGANPRNIFLADEGYNPYTSILIVSENYLKQNPEIVGKVVRASVRGWGKYMEDPHETNLHLNSLNPEMGMDTLQFGADEMRPMVQTENGIGTMTLERWSDLVRTMEAMEALEKGVVNPRECFTTQYLPPPAGIKPDADPARPLE